MEHPALRTVALPALLPAHDCRRTAARNLIRASVPERVAMLLTGHKSRTIFDRDNIIHEQELLDAGDHSTAIAANSPNSPKLRRYSIPRQSGAASARLHPPESRASLSCRRARVSATNSARVRAPLRPHSGNSLCRTCGSAAPASDPGRRSTIEAKRWSRSSRRACRVVKSKDVGIRRPACLTVQKLSDNSASIPLLSNTLPASAREIKFKSHTLVTLGVAFGVKL